MGWGDSKVPNLGWALGSWRSHNEFLVKLHRELCHLSSYPCCLPTILGHGMGNWDWPNLSCYCLKVLLIVGWPTVSYIQTLLKWSGNFLGPPSFQSLEIWQNCASDAVKPSWRNRRNVSLTESQVLLIRAGLGMRGAVLGRKTLMLLPPLGWASFGSMTLVVILECLRQSVSLHTRGFFFLLVVVGSSL